jgi:hypothetical protein
LRTGLAGEMLQRSINDRLRVAIVGNFAALVAESAALRDFIHESNCGNEIWFLAGLDEVRKQFAKRQSRDAT